MAKVEAAWPEVEAALLRAATLLQQFGYNERNLTAHSVIVPIAHYLHLRGAADSYLDSTADAADRRALHGWVTRSLIKRGIWGLGTRHHLDAHPRGTHHQRDNQFPGRGGRGSDGRGRQGPVVHQCRDRRTAQPQIRRPTDLLRAVRPVPRARLEQKSSTRTTSSRSLVSPESDSQQPASRARRSTPTWTVSTSYRTFNSSPEPSTSRNRTRCQPTGSPPRSRPTRSVRVS